MSDQESIVIFIPPGFKLLWNSLSMTDRYPQLSEDIVAIKTPCGHFIDAGWYGYENGTFRVGLYDHEDWKPIGPEYDTTDPIEVARIIHDMINKSTSMNTPAEPTFHGHTLATAIDALKAYDGGALDSGVKDEELRAWVRRRLETEMSCRESHEFLARYAREMLSEERIADGYGIEDVRALVGWLEEYI